MLLWPSIAVDDVYLRPLGGALTGPNPEVRLAMVNLSPRRPVSATAYWEAQNCLQFRRPSPVAQLDTLHPVRSPRCAEPWLAKARENRRNA
jgi:hypothetical protein